MRLVSVSSESLAVFILGTNYPPGRTWANILQFVQLCFSSIKTGTRLIMHPDKLPFVVCRSRRISKESSSRRIMLLMPVFILETHNQTNYKCLPKFVQTLMRPLHKNGHKKHYQSTSIKNGHFLQCVECTSYSETSIQR